MHLDIETLLSSCALVLLVVTAVFATTAALRHNDEANRAWTASFAAALCVTGLEAIYGVDTMPPAVLAVVDATSLFALGAMWAGLRLLDGRARSLVLIPFVVALAVVIPPLVQSPAPDTDLAAALRFGATGVFAWIAAAELFRGSMRHNLNSRILQLTFLLLGAWFICVAAISAAAVTDGRISRPPIESTALPFTAVFVVAAICLSALRVERTGNWWSMSTDDRRRTNLDVLAADAFRADARDRFDRAAAAGAYVALILVEINDLNDLNEAYGRDSGDRAMLHMSTVLRSRAPADALLGHLGAGRFVVLIVATTPDAAPNVVDAVRTGLTDAAVAPDMEIRTDASFGTSYSGDSPTTFDDLLIQADADLRRARVR